MPINPARKKPRFPYSFEKNGRVGRIYKLGNGTFKSYFRFANSPRQNTHATFDAALLFLDREFSQLDTSQANSLSLHPLAGDAKGYRELEQLLREQAEGASLRDAVQFFLAHRKTKRLVPRTVSDCISAYLEAQEAKNVSLPQLQNLDKHLSRFQKSFGNRKIHEITALEITFWLGAQRTEKTDAPWSPSTRKKVRGSLVSLSIFAQRTLNSISGENETEFQKVEAPKPDPRPEVEIYTPEQLEKLLLTALENDVELLPGLVVGNFAGLRPYEFHAEGLGPKRSPLRFEDIAWEDKLLHVRGQKVRSKATRDIPLSDSALEWLKPFRNLTGPMWRHRKAYEDKMNSLRKKAEIKGIYDGYRHSFASYRIRRLKGDLAMLAAEMGNSPKEIIDSYRRNVSDAAANQWFSIKPPDGYQEKVSAFLQLSGFA